ncbi:MAG: hypothetical protein KIG36_01815 [Eubacteriales bacterium]|nr:hypothetical protein [Eubacteriales bacterium]
MLICKYCGQEIKGKFCTECGRSAEEAGVEQVVDTAAEEAAEATVSPVDDERMIGQTVEEEKTATEEKTVDPEREERLQKARAYGIAPQIVLIIVGCLCCAPVNVVSIILSFVSIANRNSMQTLLAAGREDEALDRYDKATSAFRWSWITLIISLAVGAVAFGIGFAAGLIKMS